MIDLDMFERNQIDELRVSSHQGCSYVCILTPKSFDRSVKQL